MKHTPDRTASQVDALKRRIKPPTDQSIFDQGLPEHRTYRQPSNIWRNWAWKKHRRLSPR
jgi:hypothetical protein